MGITSLDSALSGLKVAQQQINLVSNNVANASTIGYTRKSLEQSAQAINGVGVGVLAETVIRQVDLNLERDLWTQVSAVENLSVKQAYMSRIEQFHGAPDAEISLAAEISRLLDSFTALADSPESEYLQQNVVSQAEDTANKINDYADLLVTLRNDAQGELETTVNRINDLLEQISDLNKQIKTNLSLSRTTAYVEDDRDSAIKELAGLIDISFFTRSDGVMVIQTNRGVELASDDYQSLYFNANIISTQSYYPDSINGVYIGDPSLRSAVDITELSPGGKLGGLLEVRDEIIPQQAAQIDELAFQMAQRLNAQGLLLFTDVSGSLPTDTPPDPTTLPVTTVDYVGFAGRMRVNQAIIEDPTLVQQGTANTDVAVQTGSGEVVRRVIEFAFGQYEYQQATGTIDMRSNATGAVDLQNWLGIFSENEIVGGRGLGSYPTVGDLVTLADGDLDAPADEFQITFEEARTATGPFTITVSLTNAALQAGATALDQIVAEINAQITAAGVPASLGASASVGANGELVLNSTGTMDIDGSFGATGMGQTGLTYLGLTEDTYPPEDPYFDVQIGEDNPVRIYIEPGDTEAELIDKLILNPQGDVYNAVGDTTGVPGLAYDEATFIATGELILRPGDDFNNPEFGGDLSITGGPFTVDPASAASVDIAALGAGNGVNIVSALFGSFNSGPPAKDVTPISNIGYGSGTDGSLPVPVPELAFREDYLGPNADISTKLDGVLTLVDYAQKIVNRQAQELVNLEDKIDDEQSLYDILNNQLLDESGVNIDEEMANLIVIQTAYGAAARVVTAVDEMFEELLRAV